MNVYGQLIAAQLENLSSAPAGVPAGRLYFDTTLHMPRYYDDNGTLWRTLADLTSTQTMTNKTLTSALLTTCSSQSAGISYQGSSSGSTILKAAATAGGTVTLPAATGTLATLAGAEVITNKDLDGGTASNTSRLTVPKDTLTNLTALTRKQGTLAYDTTANALLADDGSNLNQIGGGSGEKNYIAGPSTASGWTASGAGITVATTTSGLPRPNTTKTGILLTGVSGSTAYAYFRFILDDADVSKKLKFQFDMAPGTAVASDFKIDVYSNTANDYTTGNTRLALSTDSSAVTALPALTGTFRAAFDAPDLTAKYIEIRVGLNTTQTHTLVISDVIVGPGTVVQGAAVSEWAAYTPTMLGVGTLGATSLFWRRVGDSIEIKGSITCGTCTAAVAKMTLPNSYTIDTAKVAASSAQIVGHFWRDASTANQPKRGTVIAKNNDTANLQFSIDDYVNAVDPLSPQNASTIWNNAEYVSMNIFVPISQFSGSGTVNVAQNDVEYVSNSSATDAADTTSFTYGPSGSVGIIKTTTLTAARKKRVRFLTPIQQTDTFVLEVYDPTVGMWTPHYAHANGSFAYVQQNTTSYGISLYNVNATDVDVEFQRYAYTSGATFSAAGIDWSAAFTCTKWRLKKFSGGQAVGYSEGSTTALGLIKPSHTALAGAQNSYSAGTGLVRSGTYTPTVTNSSNLAASSAGANSMVWSQVGQVVTCSGFMTVQATAGSPTDTIFTMSLPVVPTSNFGGAAEAGGTFSVVSASATAFCAGMIYANSGAKTITCSYTAVNTTSGRNLTYHFSYLTN